MNCSTVLVISDDPEFSRTIQTRWCAEPSSPDFVAAASDLCGVMDSEQFNLAIIDGRGQSFRENLLVSLTVAGKAVLFVHPTSLKGPAVCGCRSSIIAIPGHENWPDLLVQMGSRLLSYAAAVERTAALETHNTALECQAALGRYTAESRHSLNNALTSVLGNAELLLLNPEALGPTACLQVETIRNMALRIHEFLQRFTSIEKEMSAGDGANNRHNLQPNRATGMSAAQ